MRRDMDFHRILNFVKLSVYFACTWPPSSSATKWQIIKYNIRWCIAFANVVSIFLLLVICIFNHHSNVLIVTQAVCFTGSTSNLIAKMIIYRIHMKRIQTQIHEMEDFFASAKPHERMVFQRYMNKCSGFHIAIAITNYMTAAILICASLCLHRRSMPKAIYLFPLDSRIVRTLVYVYQSVVIVQCSSGVLADTQAAVMMWFVAARIEILADEARRVSDVTGFRNFAEKHDELLSYAIDVSKFMRYVALTSSLASGLTAIMSGIQFFSDQPVYEKFVFVPVTFNAALNLFVCAWPADNLINVCHLLGNAVYNIAWIDMHVSTRKNLPMIIQRCQRAIIVSVSGILPTLSLSFYARFLSAVFSYFMTLRAVMLDRAR